MEPATGPAHGLNVRFVDSYNIVQSPTDDGNCTLASLVVPDGIDVRLPIHLSGWVALKVDADAVIAIVSFVPETGPVAPIKQVTFDALPGAGVDAATVFRLDGYLPAGNALEIGVAFDIELVDATGPSPVQAVHLHARYNANPVPTVQVA